MHRKLLMIAALAIAACNDTGTDPDEVRISLAADAITLDAGSTTTVSVIITNANILPVLVIRDSAVAGAILASGIEITGLQAGTTYVVASLPGHPGARDSVRVTVTANTPQQPAVLPVLGTGAVPERWTAEVAAAGQYAYTTTWDRRTAVGNAVKIWNVAGPTPLLVDSIIIPDVGTTSDVQISADGSLLVVSTERSTSGNNGIFLYSRANPARPTQVGRFTTANTAAGVHTVKLGKVENRDYAFLNIDPGSKPARLAIVDITDPAAPVEVFSQQMGAPYVHDVFVRAGILMAALWNDGLSIFDIGGGGRGGSPSAPVLMGNVRTVPCKVCFPNTSSVHNVWWFHDPTTNGKRYAFVGEEGFGTVGDQRASGALHVVDVGNLSAPVEVAIFEPDSSTTANGKNAGAHNFVMDEPSGILYAAFYNGGVRAFDVRGDLGSCTAAQKTAQGLCDLKLMGREVGIAVSSSPPKYVWGVALVGSMLYASDMHVGIHKIDVSALKR